MPIKSFIWKRLPDYRRYIKFTPHEILQHNASLNIYIIPYSVNLIVANRTVAFHDYTDMLPLGGGGVLKFHFP